MTVRLSIGMPFFFSSLAFWTLVAISGVIFLLETFGFSLEREVLATLIMAAYCRSRGVIVRAEITLKGSRGVEERKALVDTGAIMTVVDRSLAEAAGVAYTGRKRFLTSATGHKLEGEVAILREFVVEGEVLDYEKVLVAEFDGEVKKALRKLDVDDSIIVGVTTVELAGFMPDVSTGRLRKIDMFLF